MNYKIKIIKKIKIRKGGYIFLIKCNICGNFKKVNGYTIKTGGGKFCSKICYSISQKGRQISKKTKEKMKKARLGKKNPAWTGGKRITKNGYIKIYSPKHPMARQKLVPEHRLIVEKFLGRYLKKQETIHHINKNKQDNRLSNLYLFKTRKKHNKYHGNQYTNSKKKLKSNLK